MPISKSATLIPGDALLIPVVVKFVSGPGEANILVEAREYGPSISIDRADAELVSTKIAVGDEVRPTKGVNGPRWETVDPGIVAAIVGDKVWIAWPSGGDSVQALACLHRVRTREEVAQGAMRPEERDAAQSEALADDREAA